MQSFYNLILILYNRFFRKVNVRKSKSKFHFFTFVTLGYHPLRFPLCVRWFYQSPSCCFRQTAAGRVVCRFTPVKKNKKKFISEGGYCSCRWEGLQLAWGVRLCCGYSHEQDGVQDVLGKTKQSRAPWVTLPFPGDQLKPGLQLRGLKQIMLAVLGAMSKLKGICFPRVRNTCTHNLYSLVPRGQQGKGSAFSRTVSLKALCE